MANESSTASDAEKGRQRGQGCLGGFLALARPFKNDAFSQSHTCQPLILLIGPHQHINHASTSEGIKNCIVYHLQSLDGNQESIHGTNHGPCCLHGQNTALLPPQPSNNSGIAQETQATDNTLSATFTPSQPLNPDHAAGIEPGADCPFLPEIVEPCPRLENDGNEFWGGNNTTSALFDGSDFTSMFNNDDLGNEATMMDNMQMTFNSNGMSTTIPSSFSIDTATDPDPIDATTINPVSAPAATAPQATGSNPIITRNNRFVCPHANCGIDFARIGDLHRHQRAHSDPTHPCNVNGCIRKGRRAFYRHDKLLDHMRKKHGMMV